MTTHEQILELADKSDDYADQYLQSVGEYHPDWHSVRDEHFYHAAIQQYKDSLLKEVGEPVAYMTTDEEGSASMLFFDRSEALKYSGDEEPVNLFTSDQVAAAVAKATKPLEEQLQFIVRECEASNTKTIRIQRIQRRAESALNGTDCGFSGLHKNGRDREMDELRSQLAAAQEEGATVTSEREITCGSSWKQQKLS